MEEVALDAVRETLHVERPAAEMGESVLGDTGVVGDQVALGQTRNRKEGLVRVRDLNVVAAETHTRSIVVSCWKVTR